MSIEHRSKVAERRQNMVCGMMISKACAAWLHRSHSVCEQEALQLVDGNEPQILNRVEAGAHCGLEMDFSPVKQDFQGSMHQNSDSRVCSSKFCILIMSFLSPGAFLQTHMHLNGISSWLFTDVVNYLDCLGCLISPPLWRKGRSFPTRTRTTWSAFVPHRRLQAGAYRVRKHAWHLSSPAVRVFLEHLSRMIIIIIN